MRKSDLENEYWENVRLHQPTATNFLLNLTIFNVFLAVMTFGGMAFDRWSQPPGPTGTEISMGVSTCDFQPQYDRDLDD